MSRSQFLADHDLNEHIVTGALRQEPAMKFLRVRDLEDWKNQVVFLPLE